MEFEYTAVIRTLGTAGAKYQQLLDSLQAQSIAPKAIIVYIAEGYPLPKETIGTERYVYVKKGMVAQRALPYDEVETDYMLFLDDDMSFPKDTILQMFNLLKEHNADVISPDIFPNAQRPFFSEILMSLSGRMCARRNDNYWGYKVMRNSGYSYNSNPNGEVLISQTNAGACFLCTKENFLKLHFEEEMWMDEVDYALGEDQVMFYKMYMSGMKVLTWYNHGFIHLDGGGNLQDSKKKKLIYSDFRFKTIFWYRYIYEPDNSWLSRLWSIVCIGYTLGFTLLISFLKLKFDVLRIKILAIKDAICFIKSINYRYIPIIKDCRI